MMKTELEALKFLENKFQHRYKYITQLKKHCMAAKWAKRAWLDVKREIRKLEKTITLNQLDDAKTLPSSNVGFLPLEFNKNPGLLKITPMQDGEKSKPVYVAITEAELKQ